MHIDKAPIFIDWARKSKGNGTSCGGDCFLLPISFNEKEDGIDYVLLDSGLPAAAQIIIKTWNECLAQYPKSKIIGLILSHFDHDHYGGLTKLPEYFFPYVQFRVSGKTYSKIPNYNHFHSVGTSKLLYDREAAERVFQITKGRILLRKWGSKQDITLSEPQKSHIAFYSSNTLKAFIPDIRNDITCNSQDTSPENLSSLITVYLQDDHHYVFTGDSLLEYVNHFINYLPRTPEIKIKMINWLIGIKKLDVDDDAFYGKLYKLLFDFGNVDDPDQSNYPPFYNLLPKPEIDAIVSEIEHSKWYLLQLPHHGSIRNAVCSRDSTENKIFIRSMLNKAEVIFASSPGTECHIDTYFFEAKDPYQPLIVSYPSYFVKDGYDLMGQNVFIEDNIANSINNVITLNKLSYGTKEYHIFDPSGKSISFNNNNIYMNHHHQNLTSILNENLNNEYQINSFGTDISFIENPNDSYSNEIKFENQLPFSHSKFEFKRKIQLHEAIESFIQIKQLKNSFDSVKDIFPNLKSLSDVQFLKDLTIEKFEGVYSNIKPVNKHPLLNPYNLDSLKILLKYTSSLQILSWVELESIELLIEFEKSNDDDENHSIIYLSNVIISGLFKLNGSSAKVSIDTNISGECFTFGISLLDNEDKDLSSLFKNTKIKDVQIDSKIWENSIGFIGDFIKESGNNNISSLYPTSFSIFLNNKSLKLAGLEFSVNFEPKIKLTSNFVLEKATVHVVHTNKNASSFGGLDMTRVDCSFSFFHSNSQLGKLLVSYIHGFNKSILDVVVILDVEKSLVELMGYFISNFDKSLDGLDDGLKSFLTNLKLKEFGLGIDFNKKCIDNFHILLKTKDPISIAGLDFKLDKFLLYFKNNDGGNSIILSSKILIDKDKVIDLTIERKKSSKNGIETWQFESTYQNFKTKTEKIQNIMNCNELKDQDSFIRLMKDKFELEKVQILLDPSNKRALFFTSAGLVKFALGYLKGNLNLLFSFHFDIENYKPSSSTSVENKAPSLVEDFISPLSNKALGRVIPPQIDIKFMYTSPNIDKDELSNLFYGQSMISDFCQKEFEKLLEPNSILLSFQSKSTLIASLRNNIDNQDLLIFSFRKSGKVFQLCAAYDCSSDPINIGNVFNLKSIDIKTLIDSQPFSAELSLSVNGAIIDKLSDGTIVDGPKLSGTISGALDPIGFSVGLKLKIETWCQPFSIKWLFIETIAFGGSVKILPTLVSINSILVEGDFYIIPLEIQKQLLDDKFKSTPKETTVSTIKESNSSNARAKIDYKLTGDYNFNFSISNINLIKIVNDIFEKEIESNTLEKFNISKASIYSKKEGIDINFQCEINATFGDYGIFVYCIFSSKDKMIVASGALMPIQLFNSKLMIGNSSFINITDKSIKMVEDKILSRLPSPFNKSNGAAFDLEIEPKNVKFGISGGIKLFDFQGSVTAELTKTSFFLNTSVNVDNSFLLKIQANLQKDSFKFSTNIEWNISLTIPEISLFNVVIFEKHDFRTTLSGQLNVYVESSTGLLINGYLKFSFNDIEINIPSFQIKINSILNLSKHIANYIFSNFKEFIINSLKRIGNFVGKLANKSVEAICSVGKEIGKTVNEIKDWLVSSGRFSLDGIKSAFKSIYKISEDYCNSLLGIVNKVVETVKDTCQTIAEWVSAPFRIFSFWCMNVIDDINKLLFSIDGFYISFADFDLSVKQQLDVNIIGMRIKHILEENQEFKELIKCNFNLNSLKGIVDDGHEIFNHYNNLDTSINNLLNTPRVDDGRLSIDSLIINFQKLWSFFSVFVKSVCRGHWDNNKYIPHFISTDYTNGKDISNGLVAPVISLLSAVGYLYNNIQPLLLGGTNETLELYKESPKHHLNLLAELTTLSHINTSLNYNIGSNGSLVKIAKETYVIFDGRLHLVSDQVLFTKKVLKEKVILDEKPSNFTIFEGESINGIKLVKYEHFYFLLLNGVIRMVDESLLHIFRESYKRRAIKIKPSNYFMGQPIDINVTYLQGFSKKIENNEKINYEVGSIRISTMFRNTIVEIKETGDRIIQISNKLFFRIDRELKTSEAFDLLKENGFISEIKEMRMSIDNIPNSLSLIILKMLTTLTTEEIEKDNENRKEDEVNEQIEDEDHFYLSEPQPQQPQQNHHSKLSSENISKIPLFDKNSSYVYFSHGEIIKNEKIQYQNFFKTDKYIFPSNNLSSKHYGKKLTKTMKKKLIQSSIFIKEKSTN